MPVIDGIVSGFDTTGLINSVIAFQAAPIQSMRDQISDLEGKRERIAGLSNRLTDLATTLGELQEGALRAYTATASDESISVSVDSTAAPGIYDIEVQSLGNAEVSSSTTGFADPFSGSLQHGTLEITYQGETTSITIDGDNDGLNALSAQISEIDGLQAYALDTGSGATPYTLVVKGEMGSDNTIDFSFTGAGAGTALAFQEDATATDSVVEIDGQTVNLAGTSIDAIPGLTIDLTATATGPQTITVEEDLDAVTATMQSFVDAYNEVRSYYDTNTVFNADTGLKGPLVGESGARRVMETLSSMVTQQYGNDGAFEALSQLGVKTERDGKLSLDTEAFQDVWKNNRSDVEDLFFSETGPLAEIQAQIEDVFVDSDDGTLASRSESIQGSIEDLEESIARKEDFLQSYSDRLRQQFTAMESALAQSQSTSAYLSALTVQSSSGGGGLF